jgi:hypothetical protein
MYILELFMVEKLGFLDENLPVFSVLLIWRVYRNKRCYLSHLLRTYEYFLLHIQ